MSIEAAGPGAPAATGAATAAPAATALPDLLGRIDALKPAGRADLEIGLYRDWLARHPSDPLVHAAWFNLGVALAGLPDPAGAAVAYGRAIGLQPRFAEAFLNLGSQFERQGRIDDALSVWRHALDHELADPRQRPDLHCHLLNNLGRVLEINRDYLAAESMLERSLRCRPDQPDVIQHWVHLRQRQCRWPVLEPFGDVTLAMMVRGSSPLALLASHDDPALQLYRAAAGTHGKGASQLPGAAATGTPPSPRPADAGGRAGGPAGAAKRERLRIGYLSSDFCQHAVALLTVELIERHDRDRVDVTAFSWSRDDGSRVRDRIRRAVGEYVAIGALTDAEAADEIRRRGIDILIDLQGPTSGARPGILARRPAPVQATWLGFPGPTGMPWIDYVIADRYVLPEALTPFFTERPLYLPHCFQPSDSTRELGPAPGRTEAGLPADAMVYCSFNNNYKFTPAVFDDWMRILGAVPDSVLWLLGDNRWAEANLRREAGTRGIDPDRLVFAPRIAPDRYLARYRAADLFLDTHPFNAGTTASDALWAGLPLLTSPGRTFASRMAASLLNTLGLPELIASTPDDYVERAIALGQQPERLIAVRHRLATARKASPLFDMARLARDLETALGDAVEARRHQRWV